MKNKLKDPNTAPKTWTILKLLIYNEKVPVILPVTVDWKFISNFLREIKTF